MLLLLLLRLNGYTGDMNYKLHFVNIAIMFMYCMACVYVIGKGMYPASSLEVGHTGYCYIHSNCMYIHMY